MNMTPLLLVVLPVAIVYATSTPPTSTPSTTTVPTTQSNLNLWDSAFFKCGDSVYGKYSFAQGILFPPSDISMPNVTNITEAVGVFSYTYGTFCGNLNAFTQCVNESLATNETEVDRKLKEYIDIDNVNAAFGLYCNNNDSIPSHLQCTLQSVDNMPCPIGGILGILDYIQYAIEALLPKSQYCSELRGSIRCRVDSQLKPCSASYAQTMETVYNLLTAKYCL